MEFNLYISIFLGVVGGFCLFGLYLLFKKLKGGEKMSKKKKASKTATVSDEPEYDDEPDQEEDEEDEEEIVEAPRVNEISNPFTPKKRETRRAMIIGAEYDDGKKIYRTVILSNYSLGEAGAKFEG